MSELSGVNCCDPLKIQRKHDEHLRSGIVPTAAKWLASKHSESLSLIKVLSTLMMVVGLTACSPALDWRTTDIGEAAIAVTLPCKPDRATRSVPLAGSNVPLSMVGCDADGGTFAVSHATMADPTKVEAALQHWQAAVLQELQGGTSVQTQAGNNAVRNAWTPRGASPLPGAVRVIAKGALPDGRVMHMQAVWFARVVGAQVLVYHAIYLSPQARPEVADTFFAGIFLQ